MDIGMLWFDGDDSREMHHRIERAVEYYRNKYGKIPNICMVNAATIEGTSLEPLDGVEVRPNPLILPEHFWLGVEVEDQAEE